MSVDDEVVGGADRRRVAIIGGLVAALVVVIAVVAVAAGGDDGEDTAGSTVPASTAEPTISLATSIAPVPASTSPTDPSVTTSTAAGTTVPSATTVPGAAPTTGPATTAGPPPVLPPGEEVEPLPIPTGTVVRGDVVSACSDIKDRLETYKMLAQENPIEAIQQLQPALEELELDLFTAAEQQAWGDQIIEQLTNVRREWATALSANEGGDTTEAQARAAAALEFMDAALAVECPT